MKKFLLVAIVAFALYLRLDSVDWDQNQHLHPDERFLTMVVLDLKWPASFRDYLDTPVSPANPHNQGHQFFVYGTYPLLVVKALAEYLRQADYNRLTIIGRIVSAFLDVGIGLVLFAFSRRLFARPTASFLALFCYSVSVLPIQLSHFFASDTFLAFFLALCLYFLIRFYESPRHIFALGAGLSFGMAFSAKANAVLALPITALVFVGLLVKKAHFGRLVVSGMVLAISAFAVIRLAYPYFFSGLVSPNPQLLANWAELQRLSKPDYYYPPTIQWIHITPGVFPLLNLAFWGLGLPLFAATLLGLAIYIVKYRRSLLHWLPIVFILLVFLYQSSQTSQPMRYYYPLYPFLAIMAGWLLSLIKNKIVLAAVLLAIVVYPLSFIDIYHRPHSRLSASEWMFQNISPGSVISCEYWDDCLPLLYPSRPYNPYIVVSLSPYDGESEQKWRDMSQKLSSLDYVVLSSNRLYGSISASPEHYPQTAKFYQLLFSGQLGFSQVAQFVSRPSLPFPASLCLDPPLFNYGRVSANAAGCNFSGLSFVDDFADETFTVYDHPKVTIFQNSKRLSPGQIYALVFSST